MKVVCETCGGQVSANTNGTPRPHGQWRVGTAGKYQSDERCIPPSASIWSHRLPVADLTRDRNGIENAKKRSYRQTSKALENAGLKPSRKGRYNVVPPTAAEISAGAKWTLLYTATVIPA